MKLLRKLTLIVAIIIAAFIGAKAEAPSGYYQNCEGKTGQQLLTALFQTINSHTTVSYNNLWSVYQTSDVYPEDGKIWDMYSTKHWSVNGERCGNYSYVGDCYNREHSFPKSWFDDASPMYSDAFHIYPTDGKVNGQRSNYPYGECANGTTLPSTGGVDALGKLGTSTFAGYSGTVFEPVDQYKGDFARSYFYMIACYNDRVSSWDSDMLSGNSYPAFSTWALNLLLKWHRQDAVSEKETVRNDAVYAWQKNRNPFIDHPELVEYIWGTKVGTAWYANGSPEPLITKPSDGATYNLGTTAINVPKSYTIEVAGQNLTEELGTQLSGSNVFSVAPTTLSETAVNNGTAQLAVTFSPVEAGDYNATLAIGSGEVQVSVTLTATAVDGIPALPASEITEDSFIANWVNVSGDAAQYQLYVKVNDAMLPGYPVSVAAADEHYLVTELTPLTDYSYYLTSGSISSSVINVTTAAPAPSIQFLYDGDLSFTAPAGVPSEAAELLVEIENIAEDVTITVTAPFELSTDKTNWATSIALSPEEDRFYLRLYGTSMGQYSTELVATAGDYTSEAVTIPGTVTRNAEAFFEDFEANSIPCYQNGTVYEGSAANWLFNNVGVDGTGQDYNSGYVYNGMQCARFGKNSDSSIEMVEDKAKGIGTFSFYGRSYGSDVSPVISAEYSLDGGATWIVAGTFELTKTYTLCEKEVNKVGNVRVRLVQTSGSRVLIDDISVTDYGDSGVEKVDYHTWDAYSLNGELVIENEVAGKGVNVYTVDGVTVYSETLSAGTVSIGLPKGLYVVVIDDFARRVLVK